MFDFFKKKKKLGDMRVTVKDTAQMTHDSMKVEIQAEGKLHYESGQFITVIKEIDGQPIRRAYSLCSTPFVDNTIAFVVKRVAGGVMSNYLNDHLKVGDELDILKATGVFTTTYDASNSRNIVFFGGGSGITPLMSIIQSVLEVESQSNVLLVYANQNEENIIFKEKLVALEKHFPSQFKVIHILEQGEGHFSGRPNPTLINQICEQEKWTDNTEFYLCGPNPMMEVVEKSLEIFPKRNIKKEVFVNTLKAAQKKPNKNQTKNKEESRVMIELGDETFTLEMRQSDAILEKALDQGIDIPYSCQSGVCTACMGKCLEGSVSTDEVVGLSEEQIKEGYVLTCVGRPLTPNVRIKVEN